MRCACPPATACQAAWATCWIPREIQQGARIQIPGVGYPEDGYASGYMGDTMHTAFFDFTVDSAYTTQEFDGLTAAGRA